MAVKRSGGRRLVSITRREVKGQRILLTFDAGERLTVGQIAEVATLSRPAVSHHLKILRQAGVLVAERSGREVFLQVNRKLLEDALGTVLDYIRAEA